MPERWGQKKATHCVQCVVCWHGAVKTYVIFLQRNAESSCFITVPKSEICCFVKLTNRLPILDVSSLNSLRSSGLIILFSSELTQLAISKSIAIYSNIVPKIDSDYNCKLGEQRFDVPEKKCNYEQAASKEKQNTETNGMSSARKLLFLFFKFVL